VPAAIDIKTVEYTIDCAGNDDVFLDNNDSFDDAVTLNGNLEVVDGRTSGTPPVPTEIWQGFMDLPPGDCTVQLRARDADGEVICSSPISPFAIAADTTTKVNLVLVCDLSFQAPVGMLDLDATFSFVVGNFCPDLFVLSCLDSSPAEEIRPPPLPPVPVALTTCEVRFRDGDSTCGRSCDPQICTPSATGLACSPGPDPGVSTTVTCTNGFLDCDGDFSTFETACVFNGDMVGSIGGAEGTFGAFCLPLALGGTPGATVSCTAVTTDGDSDCDKTKTVSFACPGLNFCDEPTTDCSVDSASTCLIGSCDRDAQACVTEPVPAGGGANCSSSPGGGLGQCDGAGNCTDLDCTVDADCDQDGDDCTVPPAGACDVSTGLCAPPVDAPDGTPCEGATGSCVNGVCNACPNITKLITNPSVAFIGESILLQASADDAELDPIDYLWTGSGGTFSDPNAATTTFTCTELGLHALTISVSDDGFTTCANSSITSVTCIGVSTDPVEVDISLCCNNNAQPQQSIIPARLSVALNSVVAGGPFTADLGGIWIFPEALLDAAQAVVPAIVDTVDLRGLQTTVVVRAGATGPPVALPAVLPPGTCLIGGASCSSVNDLPAGGNADCVPQGSFNPCQHLVTVPRSPLPAVCAALDPPGCTVGVDCTKTDQYNLTGSCIIGPLPIPLETRIGSYTAGASGETILFGWDDQNTDASFDGTFWTVPQPSFSNPLGPNGVRVNSAGLGIAIECVMAVQNGDTTTDPVTCGLTPDGALVGSGVDGTAVWVIP